MKKLYFCLSFIIWNFQQRAISQDKSDPLVVVDGIVKDYAFLSALDTANIASLQVLKDSVVGKIISCRRVPQVILVTTRYQPAICIRVFDFANGQALSGATLELVSSDNKDRINNITDSAGYVFIHELRWGAVCQLRVSSAGYQTYNGELSGSGKKEIGLLRNKKELEGVHLFSSACFRKRVVVINCKGTGTGPDTVKSKENAMEAASPVLTLYPNPLSSGQVLHLGLRQAGEGYFSLRITSLNGQQVFQREVWIDRSAQVIDSPLPRLAAGIYLLSLSPRENGTVLQSRFIIQ